MTSCAVVLAVGARLLGHASCSTVVSRTMSACWARNELVLPTMAMRVLPKCFIKGMRTLISGVLPLLERQMTTSEGCIMPRSPCMASAACMKRAGVPVLLRVETILVAMLALLPMPVTTTLPEAEKMVSTASEKLLLMRFSRFSIAFFSSAITCNAMF